MINLVSFVLAVSCMGNMQGANSGGSCAASCGMKMNMSMPANSADAKQANKISTAAGGSCGCGMSECTGNDTPMNSGAAPKAQGHVMTPGMKM